MATRLQIRTRARVRADQDQSTFPTDAQYNDWIDEACREVWFDLLHSGWPPSFSTASLALPAAPATPRGVTMSTDVGVADAAFIRAVYCFFGGTFYELRRLNEGDRAGLYSTVGASFPSHYDVRFDNSDGMVVEFLPYVPGAQARIEYVKEHPGLASDGVQLKGPQRMDELVAIKAAAKGCRKEGNDQGAAQLDREYEYLKQCLQDMASWVNMRSPALIRDVGNPLGVSRMPGDFDIYGPDR